MGLLDGVLGSPSDQGLWALGSSLFGVRRGDEGKALMNTMLAYNQAQQEQRRNKLTDSQLALHDLQMKQTLKQLADQDKYAAVFGDPANFMKSPQAAFPPNEMDWQGSPAAPPVFDKNLLAQNLLKSGSLAGAREGIGMMQKDETPLILAEGAKAVTRHGQTIAENTKQQPQWVVIGKLANGQTVQRNLMTGEIKAVGSVGTNVSVVNKQESEEAKVVGGGFGKTYNDVQNSGFVASGKVAKLDRLEQLLTGVETGKITPSLTTLAGYAKEFGIELDPKLDVKQAATALTNSMALEMRNPAGGAGMPGAMSDRDLAFLKETVPGLGNTPGGNRLIIETQRRLAKRDAEVAKIARDYRAKKGTFDQGFYEELARFSAANPLFSDMPQTVGSPTAGGLKYIGPVRK